MSQNKLDDNYKEARRQINVCNACRYCEGICSVFPAIFKQRSFSDGDITQLANLCHNCRGCYYACQYTEPHEFAINFPKALAEVRQQSWKELAVPNTFAWMFDKFGVLLSGLVVATFAFLFWVMTAFKPEAGDGFYAYLSHSIMVVIFLPAFLLPLFSIGISIRKYWKHIGGISLSLAAIWSATKSAGKLKNLSGGHDKGCNFEDEDKFSQSRRVYHQLTLYGFLMCFASTSVATIMHYGFALEAPYGLISLPKLLGLPGGIILCIGTAGLAYLKTKADANLGAKSVWGGEMAFVLLLFSVSATGLILYALTGTSAVEILLPVHLAFVLTFFITMPYSKMVHGFYRFTALVFDEANKQAKR